MGQVELGRPIVFSGEKANRRQGEVLTKEQEAILVTLKDVRRNAPDNVKINDLLRLLGDKYTTVAMIAHASAAEDPSPTSALELAMGLHETDTQILDHVVKHGGGNATHPVKSTIILTDKLFNTFPPDRAAAQTARHLTKLVTAPLGVPMIPDQFITPRTLDTDGPIVQKVRNPEVVTKDPFPRRYQ